jgi:hypothetical protein
MENNKDNQIKVFDDVRVRVAWDETNEKWWLSVVDVVAVLTDSDYQTARKYWKNLKSRMLREGSEIQPVTDCYRLKMLAHDGKMRDTDVGDTEQILRLIQSIPSKKAEPFKIWLAQVGSERLDEIVDPEKAIDRAMETYFKKGYSEKWVNQRIKSMEVRKGLTDEFKRAGIKAHQQYASLTDIITREWSGKTTTEYKVLKGLKKENLRDHMTNTELILNMLAEAATTDIAKEKNPHGMTETAKIAKQGGKVAKAARVEYELQTGKEVVSPLNALDLKNLTLKQ